MVDRVLMAGILFRNHAVGHHQNMNKQANKKGWTRAFVDESHCHNIYCCMGWEVLMKQYVLFRQELMF